MSTLEAWCKRGCKRMWLWGSNQKLQYIVEEDLIKAYKVAAVKKKLN